MKKYLTHFMVAILAFTLAGCQAIQTRDPYTGEQKMSHTAQKGMIGAGVGAVAGALANGKKGALTGLLFGGAVGGGIGYYMDQQEAELAQVLQGTGVSVTRVGDDIVLNMPGNVTFDSGSAHVSSRFYPVLRSVSLVMQKFDKSNMAIGGHTDSVGSAEKNLELSNMRAESVRDFLASQNITYHRIVTHGFGESSPAVSNDTSEGREANRRVEIVIGAPEQA